MITIQSVMLVTLGFLFAALVGLVFAPIYRRRIARLTTRDLKRSMPLTEVEIRADKDRLRADYAILIHRLNHKVEEGALAAARQRIELNRRDAAISALEGEVSTVRTSLEEHENARRVLEHTIMDRLPKVEFRLAEARKLLYQRDREIATLTQSAEKQARALDEATQINTQQRDEIHRLGAALTTRAARSRDGLGDPSFDGEVALRTEVEALRAKSRDQASIISRLQGLVGRAGDAAGAAVDKHEPAPVSKSDDSAPLGIHRSDEEIVRLRQDLAEAEAALRSVKNSAAAGQAGREALQTELSTLKSSKQDQAAEIAQLKAALNSYQEAEKSSQAVADSKMALKARLASVQAQAIEQAGTIQSLRAELAAGNERMARQAAHFMDEMRRLGAGQRGVAAMSQPGSDATARRSLTDRIAEPRSTRAATTSSSENGLAHATTPLPSAAGSAKPIVTAHASDAAKSSGKRKPAFLRALEGAKATVAQVAATAAASASTAARSDDVAPSPPTPPKPAVETATAANAQTSPTPAPEKAEPKVEAKPAPPPVAEEPAPKPAAKKPAAKRTRKTKSARKEKTATKPTVAQRIAKAAAPAEPGSDAKKAPANGDPGGKGTPPAKPATEPGRHAKRMAAAAGEDGASETATAAKAADEKTASSSDRSKRKPGLLDRITSLDKSKEPSRSA